MIVDSLGRKKSTIIYVQVHTHVHMYTCTQQITVIKIIENFNKSYEINIKVMEQCHAATNKLLRFAESV